MPTNDVENAQVLRINFFFLNIGEKSNQTSI